MVESLKNTCLPGLFPLGCADGTQELDAWFFLLGSEAFTNVAALITEPLLLHTVEGESYQDAPNQEKG